MMGKRVLLVLGSLVLVLVGLVIYQYLTRSDQTIGVKDRPPPPPVELAEGSPYFIQRDENGNITREFGFEKRIINSEGTKGDVETIDLNQLNIGDDEGTIRVSKPWVRLYAKDRRIVEITSQTGTVNLEGPLAEGRMPKSGYLQEVRVEVYQPPEPSKGRDSPTGTGQRRTAEMVALLEGRVDFQLEFSRLDCAESVSVLAPSFAVKGRDLNLEYDQINNRLQKLQIQEIDQLLMMPSGSAGLSKRLESAGGQEQKKPQMAPAKVKSESAQVSTYRFSLTDQVVIIQPGGREKMIADEIEILADVDYGQLTRQRSQPSSEPESRPTKELRTSSFAETITTQQLGEPIWPDPNQAISMTGKGPLLITLAEDVEPGPSGNRLEMTAFGKPAQIWRERREVVRADRISFDQVRKTIYMSAGINRPVKLDWARQQWITAEKSVQFDQDAGRAVFAGPGELEFASDQMKGPAHFIYQDKLFFDFTADPNADEIDLANLKPEQLSFANGIEGAFEDMHFVAQDLMCQFEADPNGEYLPTHVVAEGPGETLRLTNEKQDYQVTGDILEGDAQTNIWRIHGNPARALTLQQEDRIEGATIIADLNKQLFEVAESSRLFASFAGDPFEPASVKPVQLHVFSRRGVTYDHAVGQIVMREPNALIEQVEKNRQVTRLLCPVLTIQLADETKMPLDEPNHVESGTNLNLATLTAHGQEVNILRSEYDLASDELLSLLKMRSKNLRFDNINQTMTAEGPGWIDSYDYQPTEPKSALPKDRSLNSALPGLLGRTGPSRAMIIFERQMRFEKPPGELTFEGDVNVGYLPLYDDPQAQLQLAGAASEMKSLRCDKLTLTFAEDKAKTDPNAPAWGDLKQVAATGSVITEAAFSDGQTHYLAGENLVYDRSTETVRMTGTMEQPIYLDGLRCTLVRWNVKDGSFEVKYVGRDGSKGENKNL